MCIPSISYFLFLIYIYSSPSLDHELILPSNRRTLPSTLMYFYFVVIHGSKLVSDSNKGNDGHNNTMAIKLLLLTLSWELNIKC